MNKWVSIKDGLPENSGFYLVWVPIPNYPECNFQPAFFIERKGTFVTPDGADSLKAEYWMAVYQPESRTLGVNRGVILTPRILKMIRDTQERYENSGGDLNKMHVSIHPYRIKMWSE